MEIIGRKIKLRPFRESDIDDVIHWMLVETEWQNWDAPWEDSGDFNPDAYRKRMLKQLRNHRNPSFYGRLEIDVLETGEHVGSVNSYYIDDNFSYTRGGGKFTIGIDIIKPANRRKGYGTEAWLLFVRYALESGVEEVYTQTWAGNYPVLALMEQIGFELINVNRNYRVVKGEEVDGYTFILNKDKFRKLLAKYGESLSK
ncbi:MAG: GNAT family N-acetyltransferase [Saccharofermentanales bacterium]